MLQTSDTSCCASPALSVHSVGSNKTTPISWYPSAASTKSYKQNLLKKPPTPQQSQIPTTISTNLPDSSIKKETIDTLKSRSGKE